MDDASLDHAVGSAAATSSNQKHGSLLSKLPFLRSSPEGKGRPRLDDDLGAAASSSSRAMAAAVQQQKSRPRKGSLRKVALLGRGAQRERRESSKAAALTIDTKHFLSFGRDGAPQRDASSTAVPDADTDEGGLGLNISDITPRPSMDGFASRSSLMSNQSSESSTSAPSSENSRYNSHHHMHLLDGESLITSPTISYTSTTDEEDVLHLPPHVHRDSTPSSLLPRPELSLSSGSESYFAANRAALHAQQQQHRRSGQHAKSPLSYSGLVSTGTPLPSGVGGPDADHDYAETEWWGWVVLIVTWFVFVIGMGSCLGVWSWAWDVGTTPYAPPELEDDPTLPIVGYYPALMILTCVMAWVWVVVAWVGMKYFRHAKISGD